MHRTIMTLLLALTAGMGMQAQTLRPITIGNKVPDVAITHLYNYNGKTKIRFSSLKGKLVLLDFWFAQCPGCIEAFPKMEGLQKEFGDKVQIITVNRDTKEHVDSVFGWYAKNKVTYGKLRQTTLPTELHDTVFTALFPHSMDPHEVWIDGEGIVRAITGPDYVTAENMQTMLEGAPVSWPVKKDFLTHDPQKALLPQIYDFVPDSLAYYSCVFKNVQGLRGPVIYQSIDSAKGTVRITRQSSMLLAMYAEAVTNGATMSVSADPFEDPLFAYGKKVILDVRDSTLLIHPKPGTEAFSDWYRDHSYSYEGVFPLEEKKAVFEYMRQDLNRYFHLNGRMEKRKMKCWALVRKGFDNALFDQSKATPVNDQNRRAKLTYYTGGLSLGSFFTQLGMRHKDLVFVNDTGINPNQWGIWMEGTAPLTDLDALKTELMAKYHLDLVQRTEDVDVMVISQN